MSNLLLDSLPEAITVDGREYPIYTDFRTGIILEKILEDKKLDGKEMFDCIMALYFVEEVPENKQEALNGILDFYNCGKKKPKPRRKAKMQGRPEEKKGYDFLYDDDYVYSAFLTQYGVDLNDIEYLHWWKFMAMFKSLESHNKIIEIIGYRKADLGKITDKNERARIANLQKLYELPRDESIEEKIARQGAMFGGMI